MANILNVCDSLEETLYWLQIFVEGLREYEIIGLQIHNTLTFYINFPFEVEEFYYVWKNTLRTEEDTLVSYQPKSLVYLRIMCTLFKGHFTC